MKYKVVFEIEVSAENKLEAAKEVRKWLADSNTGFQFYVQDTANESIASVDLDEDEVIVVNVYHPLIENKKKYQY